MGADDLASRIEATTLLIKDTANDRGWPVVGIDRISRQHVAEFLQVTPEHLANLASIGEGPTPSKLGAGRYSFGAIAAWIEENRVGVPTADLVGDLSAAEIVSAHQQIDLVHEVAATHGCFLSGDRRISSAVAAQIIGYKSPCTLRKNRRAGPPYYAVGSREGRVTYRIDDVVYWSLGQRGPMFWGSSSNVPPFH